MPYRRSFLKWAGSKYQLISQILKHLPPGQRLLEPFFGSGVVFLNSSYSRYVVNDINTDLMNAYKSLKKYKSKFIQDVKKLFTPENNCKERYLELRQYFNETQDPYQRGVLFIYLNRHGYNGLCRYNQSGIFNVPFGSYKKVSLAEDTLNIFINKLQLAQLHNKHYIKIFAMAQPGDVIYCDPPYISNHQSLAFKYFGEEFTIEDQQQLADLAHKQQKRNITTIVSNHANNVTLELYSQAKKHYQLDVFRSMNCIPKKRCFVKEILAIY